MSTPLASESDLDLVFAWENPRRRRLAIAGFVGASAVLHALCFYVFQIIYPPAVALLPPPGRITVIAPNTEEGRILLRWLEAEDPALASNTQLPVDGKSLTMPTIQHAPSYLARQPVLRDLPSIPPDPALPSAQPPAPVPTKRGPIEIAPIIAPTLVRWSPELETRGALQSPEMKFTASGRESPQAAQFRVAVDGNGTIRYCFVAKSSGDAALDEQVRKYLTLSRFSPIKNRESKSENGFTWGTATVEWGNDLAARPPKDESVAP